MLKNGTGRPSRRRHRTPAAGGRVRRPQKEPPCPARPRCSSLCCGNVCSNAKAPQSQPAGPRAPDAGLGHPQRPPAARRAGALQPPPGRPPAHRAQHGGVRLPAAGQRGLSGVARAQRPFRQRFGHAGASAKPAQGHGAPATTTAADDAQRPARWDERLRFRPSLQRNIVKPRDWQKQPTPSSMASSTKTCFPPPNGASAVSRRCRCWTSAAGRRTSSPTTTPR